MLERGAHRDRVRVPRVVDQQPAAGQRQLLVAPLGERHVDALRDLEPERARRRERDHRVGRKMLCAEVDVGRAERRTQERRLERFQAHVLADADDLDVRAADGEARRHDRRPAGRQRVDQLALRANDSFEVADLLEVHGCNVRDHADVRSRERAQLRDLAEAAHRQLEDADLGVRLDAANGERHADLVVEAALRCDGPRLRGADRGEDVLRRGLAHRARDRDEARVDFGRERRLRARRAPQTDRRGRAWPPRRGRTRACGSRRRRRARRTGRPLRCDASRPARR